MRLGAVILAAGAGSRFGGAAKALLLLRGRTFLESLVEVARAAGLVDGVVVVGPPYSNTVAGHARSLGLRFAVNADPARGMASSVSLGFAALAERTAAAAWLWPVDHPSVRVETLQRLIDGVQGRDAARPRYEGRGGHPPLIARKLWPRLVGCVGLDGGARAVLATADVAEIDVDDRGVVWDIDTPEELARGWR